MTSMFSEYRTRVLQADLEDTLSSSLRISEAGALSTYYAPFDHVNAGARVVLVGITPGVSQAQVGLRQLRRDLLAGLPDAHCLQRAKETASFSGAMRTSLVALLDEVGLHSALEIDSCAALFGASSSLVHYTSALRYPVLLDGQNYAGTPSIVRTPYLLRMIDTWLAAEAAQLADAVWVPLGREPTLALEHLVKRGVLAEGRVLSGLPHPSGANAERISYFLGRKERSRLSSKTNPDALDLARNSLTEKVAALA